MDGNTRYCDILFGYVAMYIHKNIYIHTCTVYRYILITLKHHACVKMWKVVSFHIGKCWCPTFTDVLWQGLFLMQRYHWGLLNASFGHSLLPNCVGWLGTIFFVHIIEVSTSSEWEVVYIVHVLFFFQESTLLRLATLGDEGSFLKSSKKSQMNRRDQMMPFRFWCTHGPFGSWFNCRSVVVASFCSFGCRSMDCNVPVMISYKLHNTHVANVANWAASFVQVAA